MFLFTLQALYCRVVYFVAIISLAVGNMTIKISDSCSYQILVNGDIWLVSGPTFFRGDNRTYSTADGSLKQTKAPVTADGADMLGKYKKTAYIWKGGKEELETDIKYYKDVRAVVFSQVFVSGVTDTSTGNMNLVISGFPTFQVGGQKQHLGWMAYSGVFIGWYGLRYGRWNSTADVPGGIESGPIALFDNMDNVIVMSSFSQFMAASYAHNAKYKTIDWGIMGQVNAIPAGYQYDTIVFYSASGINKAMEEWGQLLRKWYRRSTSARDIDTSINYIGYYTDNGAYYRNFREPNKTYEETIKGIVDYAHHINIPYRYLQLDDWWYPVKGPGYGATITWTANPKVFPHGLQFIYNLTQWPVVGHNRYWSSITPYAKQNGGKYNFIIDGAMSLPDDQAFWDYLLADAKEWGLSVYEQDWLNYQVEKFGPLHKDATLGKRWLHQMGESALRYGMQIQYCMALPRHLLASLEVPVVSQIRASTDYHLKDNQWTIGVTSIFAHAMGLAPFKDNLWTKHVQPGNVYHKTEPYPLLQATVALLSTGPVGIGDRIGYTDFDLLNRLINADGLLLKPSKPATAIDKQIIQLAFGDDLGPDGEVWSTYSDIAGMRFEILFCPQIIKNYLIGPKELHLMNIQYAVYSYTYDFIHDTPQPFDRKHPLMLNNCTNDHFCLYYLSPVIAFRSKPLIILGELAKLVPMSPQRVLGLSYDTSDVTVVIQGKPGELVTFYFIHGDAHLNIQCKIKNLGTAIISLAKNICF